MSCWTFLETNVNVQGIALGSGYPSGEPPSAVFKQSVLIFHQDPRTIAWLESNIDPVFGFPNIARFSWSTVKNLLEKKGARVEW